jgi:glutamine amidotransferase
MKAAVIDVGIGNIKSVVAALDFLGVERTIASEASVLEDATHLVLPGVGSFAAGMRALEQANMVEAIRKFAFEGKGHVLGICLGMQLLAEHSEEGDCAGLGLLPANIELLDSVSSSGISVKVPHVGFSAVHGFNSIGLFDSLPEHPDFYFTHSYALKTANQEVGNFALCEHGETFIAAFQIGRLCGAQFHPEKSQTNGLRFLKNYFSLDSN